MMDKNSIHSKRRILLTLADGKRLSLILIFIILQSPELNKIVVQFKNNLG